MKKLTIVIEKDQNGYFAKCLEIQGCFTQGQTLSEILDNVKDVILLHQQEKENERAGNC